MDVDLSPEGGRYDCGFFVNDAGRQVVQLNTQIAKGIVGPQYEIAGPREAFHDFELIYEPEKQAAKLLVDGVERLSGYKGHREYLGPLRDVRRIGVRSQAGEAIFRKVSFAIGRAGGAILPGR